MCFGGRGDSREPVVERADRPSDRRSFNGKRLQRWLQSIWIRQVYVIGIDHLEIEALGPASESERETASPLVERIRRNAEAVRARWLAEETATMETPRSF